MALNAVHLPSGTTSAEGFFRLLGRLVNQSGVLEATALTVSAQATPDMTVRVSGSAASDNAVFVTSTGNTYHGWNTAPINVTIPSNASGVTKKDSMVAYINTALVNNDPNTAVADNPGGMVITRVRGNTTDGSGNYLPPTDSEIDTAVTGKPWMRGPVITIANGATSINSGNITGSWPFAGVKLSRSATYGTSAKPLYNFVPRLGLASSGYDLSQANGQGSWGSNTSIQGIVGTSSVAVMLYVEYYSTGGTTAAKVSFAKSGTFTGTTPNGVTTDARVRVFPVQVTNLAVSGTTVVELDASQRLDIFYDAATGTPNLKVTVLGWWEPAGS